MTTERWNSIPGFDGRYEVSDMGRVRVTSAGFGKSAWFKATGGVMKQYANSDGYLALSLTHPDGKKRPIAAHRLVLIAFVGPCPAGMECCHRNGIRTDNALSNLRWGTEVENARDRGLHGTQRRGTDHPMNKLSVGDVLAIRASGESHNTLAARYRVQDSLIWAIRKRRIWRHV